MLTDDFFEEATQKIFDSGIFGFQEANREEIIRLNQITQKRGPRWLVRTGNLLHGAFPSYRSMRFAEAYAFLNGRPYLLPAAWVYRFYRAARYRLIGNGKRMVKDALVSDRALNEHRETLKRWGL